MSVSVLPTWLGHCLARDFKALFGSLCAAGPRSRHFQIHLDPATESGSFINNRMPKGSNWGHKNFSFQPFSSAIPPTLCETNLCQTNDTLQQAVCWPKTKRAGREGWLERAWQKAGRFLRQDKAKVFGSRFGARAVRPRNVELEREMINTLRPN